MKKIIAILALLPVAAAVYLAGCTKEQPAAPTATEPSVPETPHAAVDREECTCLVPYTVCINQTQGEGHCNLLYPVQFKTFAFWYNCNGQFHSIPLGTLYGNSGTICQTVNLPANTAGTIVIESGCAPDNYCPFRVCLSACQQASPGKISAPYWSACYTIEDNGAGVPATFLHCDACE
ncbi:MAG: hypothetical protein H6575_06190 [Lewinellaceae bacterium]|nr:hypothetical protein [Saprospiraceae bacterium]MCB9354137.1 hypothetical protein [Lewinellaceae bacterium]